MHALCRLQLAMYRHAVSLYEAHMESSLAEAPALEPGFVADPLATLTPGGPLGGQAPEPAAMAGIVLELELVG
jgi:hypothetical protein